MADMALSSLGTIANIALQIKEAVETVHQNENQCRKIASCVQTNSGILELLVKETDITKVEVMCRALEDVKATFEDALKLVKKCQNKHIFCRFILGKDMANDLNLVLHDIGLKMQQASLCCTVHNATKIHYASATAPQPLPLGEEDIKGVTRFRYSVLEEATNYFSEANKIAEGGYSSVYKGVLHDGREVAIKRLNDHLVMCKNDMCLDEFTVGIKLQHRNVVSLLGYYIEIRVRYIERNSEIFAAQERKSILVLRYVPNGSLEDIVAGKRHIDWSSCFEILQQIAQGVQYIHQQRVIHLDLKPANILFKFDMTPVIIDFGLSKVLEHDDDEIDLDGKIGGTPGFMAPEHYSGRVSLKSDVFAFGITLLQTMEYYTATGSMKLGLWPDRGYWKRMLKEAGGLKGLDNRMVQVDECQLPEIKRCVEVGLPCTKSYPGNRPSMADVVDMLSGKKTLPTPNKPHSTPRPKRGDIKKMMILETLSTILGRAD